MKRIGDLFRFVSPKCGINWLLALGAGGSLAGAASLAALEPSAVPSPAAARESSSKVGSLYIQEYRVTGARQLTNLEIGEAVYPFLGPGRSQEDVEKARAALEKAFKDKGFQTVTVQVPSQQVRGGIVVLEVVEATVGRLRVHGSRYYSLAAIKRNAPSLAEGTVPNFSQVTRDIVALNQLADRRVTPTLRAGILPGTVDIDLDVKDTLPLHGNFEFNNRNSADTSELRLNGSISYNNLWQLGHSIGASFQIAPQRLDDATVFSGYYLARFPELPGLTVTLQGTKQDSNVSTLGGAAVAGRGEVVGLRVGVTLPALKDFYHSLSFGIDYKHFEENVLLGTTQSSSPITYYPLSAAYGATWAAKGASTELNAGVTFGLRGVGSDSTAFDTKRFRADGNFIYFRGDLSHLHDLSGNFQVFGKVQGQVANQPLLNSEQFSGGGLGTVRGYLESAALGDNAIFGSLELRTPSLGAWLGKKTFSEWRFYGFTEGGLLTIKDRLPDQQSRFDLASYGVGTRLQLFEHFNGSLDAGVPLVSQSRTPAGDVLLTFRVWADF